MEAAKPLRLRCSVQNYDWGRSGEESTVARLFARNSAAEIEPETPYAEFWMGTHPSGPSTVFSGEADADAEPPATLKSWIVENRGALGEEVVERWGADLPFLFKVLSVEKALSIQAHPDKELAKLLHGAYPSLYKDSNHKPEMAVALTEFRALCGFISVEELRDVISTVPEIAELIGNENAIKVMDIKEQDGNEKVKALLQSIFTKLMTASKEEVSEAVSSLKMRLNMEQKDRLLSEKEELALLLEKQYPVDVGVISAFFFNYVKLNPGEALYLGANEPHAYISGECIECMATSDNVVRAGLTPKYRDVRTLCSMLTYKQGFPEILCGVTMNPYVLRYTPPFEEFEVDGCLLPPGTSTSFPAVRGPSILIAVAGEGTLRFGPATDEYAVKDGCVFFVPANAEISLTSIDAGSLHMYRAGINSMFFI